MTSLKNGLNGSWTISAMEGGDFLPYEMWLNYDNDAKTFQFPVLPESIKVTEKGNSAVFNIDQIGEIFHKAKRNALRISFASFFPKLYGNYCQVPKRNFKGASKCHAWIKELMEAENPAHFVLTGSPMAINCYVLISSYVAEEAGGDVGSVNYTIELQEYRSTSLRTVKKSGKNTLTKSESKNRVSNKERAGTITVKSGDCLWNLAKKYYGSGSEYIKILNANKAVLDKAAKQYGYRDSNNGNRIFPGTVLTIP